VPPNPDQVEFLAPKSRVDRPVNAMPDDPHTGPPTGFEDVFVGTPYRALQRLGAGGMGEVFLVEHRELERQFVAKVMHERFATNEHLLDRMRMEAQTLGRLDHINIVSVSGFDVTRDRRPFIIMEHLHGRTLADEIGARGALPYREALAYVIQLLAALEAGHALGIVHRDIKPDNLFLADGPDGARVLKVLDYGVVRVLPGFSENAPPPLTVPTETGLVVGTPRYVSPEGALGKKVDERADLYAAGLILYLLLAGRGPFDHLRVEAQILGAHANVQPVAPSAAAGIASGCRWPSSLDEIVLCALRKDPRTRFTGATQFRSFLQELADLLDQGVRPALPSARQSAAPAQTANAGAATSARTDGDPANTPTFSSTSLHIPFSTPSLRQLLLFIGVVSITAVAVSQLVRLVLAR
jgi:eukaryotic-like serine/threonine-protein kinase